MMANFTGVATDETVHTSITTKDPGSTVIKAMGRISQSLTPVAVGAATCAEQNFTVKGLKVGDFVDISPPSITAGVGPICARVSATDTLTVTFVNPTVGSLTPPAGVYQIQLCR
jgi:hypothetical protein